MRKFTKKITSALITGIMAIMMCVPAFAAEAETQELVSDPPIQVSATLYKTGLDELSMGNGAFSEGGTLTYNRDTDGNIVSTTVILNVMPVTAGMPGTGIQATGYLTNLTIAGKPLDTTRIDRNGHITQFSGTIEGKVDVNTRYNTSVKINLEGAHPLPSMSGEIVFN